MEWIEIGLESLHAAKAISERHPRSCVSRCYYAAAHVMLTDSLHAAGYLPIASRQTPPHNAQAGLIGAHLAGKGQKVVKDLRAAVRRLYRRRLDADYSRKATVDRGAAIESLRDVSTVFRLLKVVES